MKVAVAKYPVGALRDFDQFAAKQRELIGDAKAKGARLAVLPEYLALELAGTFAPPMRGDLRACLAALQPLRDAWLDLFSGLAREIDLHNHAGTFPLDVGHGRYRNRSDLFGADGSQLWQDKLRLAGFEKATGMIEPGDALKVFELDDVRAAIAVGYDCEFPLPVHAQCEAGARLLLVPSCSDSQAAASRVRVGCLARALENRCFVAQAAAAGDAPWNPLFDTNSGEAALIAPMDVGLPHDGMLVQTRGGMRWVVAELDVDALDASRAQAQASNDRDWATQYFPSVQRVRMEGACLENVPLERALQERAPLERASHHAAGNRAA
jgi:predicted amidohydrolase